MFLAHGTQCVYKNRVTLHNHIYDVLPRSEGQVKVRARY
jgi:hypothetical protein